MDSNDLPRRQSRLSLSQQQLERGTWGSKLDFFFSCLGYAVGFGNVWRFPYLCYDSGGGAFLIPFAVMLVTIGIPIYFLEVALGQYSACGPVKLFRKMCPLLGGVGYAMVVNNVCIMLYYNVIIAWTLYYLYIVLADLITSAIAQAKSSADASAFELEWARCGHEYNTPACQATANRPDSLINLSATNFAAYSNKSVIGNNTMTWLADNAGQNGTTYRQQHAVSPAEEFFYNKLLYISDSISETGTPLPHLIAALGVAWLVAFLCLAKGLKSSGKVVWFTALFPYVVLVILLIRGVTLPGYEQGIKYYMQPDMQKLGEYNIWMRAGAQIFFSLSVAGGGLSTYGSYNKFNNNVFLDATIVPILDCLTSIFAGFVVFAFIGFIAHTLGQPVQAAAREGTALVFIAYPEVITRMPWSMLWAIAFNLMMLTLGIDTQFAFIETVTTALIDDLPRLQRRRTLVYAFVCTASFVAGLIFCTRAGYFWFNLVDYYVAGWPLIFFALIENLAVLLYGVRRLADEDVHAMLGRSAGWYLKICWWLISPTIMIGLLLITCFETTPITYEQKPYPMWAQITGWSMACANASIVPVYALYKIFSISGWCGSLVSKRSALAVAPGSSFWDRLRLLTEPEHDWNKNARLWRLQEAARFDAGSSPSNVPAAVLRQTTSTDVEAPLLLTETVQEQYQIQDSRRENSEEKMNGSSANEFEMRQRNSVLTSAAKPDSCFLT